MLLSPVSFHPLTAAPFPDFEQLFGPRGACGGCWGMFWKLRGRAFSEVARRSPTRPMFRFVMA